MWFCYLLATTEGSERTYVGATTNLDRRLRQHNQEITGGAFATKGRAWERIAHVKGFPDERTALQFEWRWKRLSHREEGTPIARRYKALFVLLGLGKATTHSLPYDQYNPEVVVENEERFCDASE